MPAIIACSICRTILTPGAQVCPGCGLPLVAQAARVVQPPKPNWPVALGVAAVFAFGIWIVNAIEGPIQEKKQQEFTAALHSDLAGGKLDTPEKFIARCGAARTRKGSTLYYTADPHATDGLNDPDLAVAFPPNAPPTYTIDGVREDSRGKFHDTFKPAEMDFVEQFCAAHGPH
jgi:hypothetical protein